MKESKLGGGRTGVYYPEHPHCNNRGYVLKYRYIMEQYLGRILDPEEHIHHVDGDPDNNDISNLVIMTRAEHIREHMDVLGGKRTYDWDEIRALYGTGIGCRKIAKIIGSTKRTVQIAINKMGIMRR